MSASVRVLFFTIALFTMLFLAFGSTMMAQGNAWWATIGLVLGVLLAATGFVAKRKWIKKPSADS